ncbi:MAG: P1 family peptidase [Candidatus Adiutrix sp.]|jgi:L-aminopeptidase/D-esterase-like protein|nr:P1 family peptidase [Candidatus Adiutrix sp.]
MSNQTLTAIPGLLAGHAADADQSTGCTAILCPAGFTPGLAVPGFAPGCRETELMRPESLVEVVHGLLLSGGSAFGLSAADGLVRFLREQGHGLVMPHGTIPIVPGAVIYDLDGNRKPGLLPDAAMGYAAARDASAAPLPRGRVGAGTGARCGRLYSLEGPDRTSPGGLGSSLVEYRGVLVGAVVVVNALGNVHDPGTGICVAGGRDESGRFFDRETSYAVLAGDAVPRSNTVLTVVASNIPLDKTATSRLARMAATGLARTIRPAHLTYDGDIVFALSPKEAPKGFTGSWSENLLGAMGGEAVALAVLDAVRRP